MVTHEEDQTLARCRRLIEEKLGRGRSEEWVTQDFEHLSELIAAKTGVSLSITTLKRVWGRVKYESVPTATTLTALVQFIGYENWQQFKSAAPVMAGSSDQAEKLLVDLTKGRSAKQPVARRWLVGFSILSGLMVLLVFLLSYEHHKPLSPEDFTFSCQPVTTGIPNSVVFHYDAMASPTDSVFIQQSWDPSRRQLVPKNGHEHTSIYYHPGYFRAKLVVGDQLVQEHNLLIPSAGWHVAVMQEPVPVYFAAKESIRNGVLGVTVEEIQRQHILMQPKPPTTRFRYVRDFERLPNDNFTLETRLKSNFKQGSSICQHVGITILCKNEYFHIPLSAKGCVGGLDIYLAGHSADARHTNLSGFGADLSEWVDVRCYVRNKQVQVFVNGQQAYEAIIPTEAKDVVGISYDFEGTGSIDFVRFSRADGTVAFEDSFDSLTLTTTKGLGND
ncbi:hypothetical protein GCM10028806_07910 [Spirosoma terrae]|uniref:Uncharacterized protein n=1 Tax=Spirosoma terrae TaxID=1968276 RepID=A0A6L9L9D6_9BACT|nr:hypothetical protein [Spirosoma terrae]NDU96067.1 hypothetical protein [Spirosoma terrae]